MTPLPIEAAETIFREYLAWFGPPALLRQHPEQFSFSENQLGEQETYILDGRTRFRALAAVGQQAIWLSGKLPFLVFPLESIHSNETHKLLPRCLVLAGHYERAALHVPEVWSHTPQDVAAFLNVPLVEAFKVCAALRDERKRAVRQVHQRSRKCVYIVHRIESRLAEHCEGERPFTLEELAQLLQYDGPIV